MDRNELRALMHGTVDAELENLTVHVEGNLPEVIQALVGDVLEDLIGKICHSVCEKVLCKIEEEEHDQSE